MASRRSSLLVVLVLVMAIVTGLACAPFGETSASAAATAAPTVTVAPTAAPGAKRSVWIWEKESFRLLDDEAYRQEIRTFLRGENVSILYLYADEFQGRNILREEPEKLRGFISEMHRSGFEVYALLGSWYLKTPEYILPEKRPIAVRMFRNVLTFNTRSDTVSRFDGVNIDIEPYLLDDWNARKALRAAQYLDLAAEFMRMKREARSAMSVGPAMPFWFDGIEDMAWNGHRKRLNEHVQDIYDYVAIMDYRNFAVGRDGMIAHATDELDYADRIGRKVVIGVETLRTEPAKVTFFGKGRVVLERELQLAAFEFSRHSSFQGFAIHHLATYRTLVGASRAAPHDQLNE